MAITLTERAAAHFRRVLPEPRAGVRLGVRRSGCSGLSYVVEPATEVRETDVLYESLGIRVVVDSKDLVFLEGTEIDYVREGLNEGLRFFNPNAAATCGCGGSFSIEA